MYLLDTNIISAVAPTRRDRPEALVRWLVAASDLLFLSVITASEIQAGVCGVERRGETKKAERLRDWWNIIEHAYGQRLLPIDLAIAHAAGRLLDRSRAHDTGYEDIAIAATADVFGLTVLTANERHFEPLGVRYINPLKTLPDI